MTKHYNLKLSVCMCLLGSFISILLSVNSASGISPESLAETIIKEIKEKHSRSAIMKYYNWQVIFEEQQSQGGLDSQGIKSAEELKQNSLSFAESGNIAYPKEISEILKHPERRKVPLSALPQIVSSDVDSEVKERLKRAEFYIKEVKIKEKIAEAKINQVLDQQIYPATLNMRYLRDNWYVDHLKPGNLGLFIQN